MRSLALRLSHRTLSIPPWSLGWRKKGSVLGKAGRPAFHAPWAARAARQAPWGRPPPGPGQFGEAGCFRLCGVFCFDVLLEAGPAGQGCLVVVQERSPQIEWPQGDCILLIFLWSKPLNCTAGFQGHQAATCITEKRDTLEDRNITKNDLHSFQRRFSAFLVTHVHSLSRREWPPSTLGKEKPA